MNARAFTIVYAKKGFWHVQLDEQSSLLTTFGTPWGMYRWTRMPFGISVAPEEFQRRLDNALEGLNGVKPIFNDILLYVVGMTDAEALSDHDTKLRALFQRCRDRGIILNKETLKLRCSEVFFMGHTVSKDGLKPDPAKLQGIQEMPSPQNKQDVKQTIPWDGKLPAAVHTQPVAGHSPTQGSPERNQPVLLGHPTRAKRPQCQASHIRSSSFEVL